MMVGKKTAIIFEESDTTKIQKLSSHNVRKEKSKEKPSRAI